MTYLGIELGSTRIKAALIDENRRVIASGVSVWENSLDYSTGEGLWTYSLDEVWNGLRAALSELAANYGKPLEPAAMGVSAMMHGYLAFGADDELLTPFRTWRCTNTGAAAERLTELFGFNIPLRWSAAHLYQAILNGEAHTGKIAFMTTLAGYVHWQLTGRRVLGIGDASGMFPVGERDWDAAKSDKFRELTDVNIRGVLPAVLLAGEDAGALTPEGSRLLGGLIPPGTPLCPPEGDAGTGMVATNCVRPRTCNVSAGTSVFAMAVLERPLSAVRREIDIVATPDGAHVAMVHYNECTIRVDSWIELFGEALRLFGCEPPRGELFAKLYETALDKGTELSQFMRQRLTDAVYDLAFGMRILTKDEDVEIDKLVGHGGYFKSGDAGRVIMSELLGLPVTLTEVSAEGGAYGMALLAAYYAYASNADARDTGAGGATLADFLENTGGIQSPL